MLLTLRRSMTRDDDGFALLTVIMSMFVLTLAVSVAMAYALQTQTGSRRDQDYNGALAVARAGVDDLLSRLNQNDTYWQQYPGYSPNAVNFDCTNIAWKRPWPTGSPCGWGAGTPIGWTTVPGSTGAQYHYDLNLTNSRAGGVVLVTSTGKVRGVSRTVQAALLHDGFGEFLYLTDYETVDPANEAVYGVNNTTAQAKCAHHTWDPVPRDSNYCSDINFVGGDTINGPLHSNDALLMYGNPGTDFDGTVTTSWPACNGVTAPAQWPGKCYRENTGAGTPRPSFAQGIAYRGVYTFPNSITGLKQYVDPLQTSPAGCLYSGPTRIVFTSDGKMKVWSNWSKTLNPGCGNPTGTWPQTLTVPSNNLIYVQDVPSGQTSPTPGTGKCSSKTIDASDVGQNNGTLPVANDYNATLRDAFCNLGTAYVEGALLGKVTVTAENNVIVTDDLTYAGGTNGIDTLGLIANNSVKIYHPINCTNLNTSTNICSAGNNLNRADGTKFNDPVVNAAILTLAHSFAVESYQLGAALGTLSIYGSFSQRYRGAVGTFGSSPSGFLKNYVYDNRLKYAPPPYFLNPIASSWGAKTYGELKRAY